LKVEDGVLLGLVLFVGETVVLLAELVRARDGLYQGGQLLWRLRRNAFYVSLAAAMRPEVNKDFTVNISIIINVKR
jgi:hypothetical protein